ncbi:invasion associated locus B family protein [Segnochrobactrum spirostomi]|uniref:Invasion associated locus B family protein n=1 Tax=Segnochrobactrum spirostomi TaxID=2608987 RepID=A0A6A7Y743_9HYPH|nr:invasion associated locus B family protein [Segnochrobactrum spirostomi]MQT15104.1 invasion associated locus B family protein [Segnochrobactrum spirostomi]
MSRSVKIALVTAMTLAMTVCAEAQTTKTKTAPSASAEQATSTLPGGATSLQETYDDWSVACAMPGGRKSCSFSQTQVNQQNQQRVLAIELTSGQDGAITGVLAMPFGLALADGVTLQIDDAAPGGQIAYQTCLPVGCVVPLKFNADYLANLEKGKQLKVNAVAADTGKPLTFTISLKGFAPALSRTRSLSQ